MRISDAALALITRVNADGETEYLTQWNKKWLAYSLIGGHREEGETFRESCIREIEEELGVKRDVDFTVATDPLEPRIEFRAHSKSAAVETWYRFELFRVQFLTLQSMAKMNSGLDNSWLTLNQIERGIAGDGRRIAEQVQLVVRSL